MADEDIEVTTDKELFDAAIAEPEPQEAQPEPEAVAPEPKVDQTGRLHGDGGKFVPKTPKAEVKAEPQAAPEHIDHRVPLTELLNEREKRQRFEQEIAEAKREREALARQLADLRQQQQPAPKDPDIFEDPQGFVSSLRNEFQQSLRQQEANFSFRLAHRQHGQDFETAYQSLIREGEMGNRQTVQSVMNSADPGEALMRWHRQSTLYEKTGGDLDKFLQTHTEKLLEDEAFLAKAIEKVRARGAQPNGQRPASVVQLPPSLNKVAAAAPALDGGDDEDMTDEGLLKYALSR